jgi:galactokinase
LTDFTALYRRPPAVIAAAPGRINLIGEHTDYNGGFVLPTAISLGTRVELAPRADNLVRAWSASTGDVQPLAYSLGAETRGRGWLDYVQGVTSIFSLEGLRLDGFDLRIQSTLPLGSGLASSAALEVSLLRGLREVFGIPIDDIQLALLGQRAEREFVGANVGIMDQLVASLGDEGQALFVDTRSLAYEKLPLPEGCELVVIDSGVSHANVSGHYNARRAECERACALLGVSRLRDIAPSDLGNLKKLPEPLERRVRHVMTENERVLSAVDAICVGDLERLGSLFYASHESLRLDYEVSIQELDLLVALARAEASVYGARLTGAGFGGSVLVLARSGAAHAVSASICRAYSRRSSRSARVLLPVGSESASRW